jgi:hypothetical protein
MAPSHRARARARGRRVPAIVGHGGAAPPDADELRLGMRGAVLAGWMSPEPALPF